jgi:hypothetical protein
MSRGSGQPMPKFKCREDERRKLGAHHQKGVLY